MSVDKSEPKATHTASTPGFSFPMLFGMEALTRSMHDALERSRAAWDEYARLEAQGLDHARSMMGEGSKLAIESLNYAAQLGAEWRKVSLEATRRVVDNVTPSR